MYNLTALNPWWLNREEIGNDDKIKDFNNKKYRYYPPLLTETLYPGNIYSLRGPRQLGKTTALKLIIQSLLLKKQINPYSVFFWSCEDITDFQQLVELIMTYSEMVSEKNLSEQYIFLDEISFVKEWQRGIKLLADRGFLKKTCLMLTGSNIIDIKSSVERLPGRKGRESKDFTLLPLTFYEFIELIGFDHKIKTLNDLKILDKQLQKKFSQYLITGGFPLVINEILDHGNAPSWLKDVYFSWIIGDVLRGGRSEKVALQIISSLIRKQPSLLSWDALAKDAEIKSHLTISSYLELFEEMFVLKINYFYNHEKKMPDPNKNKKIHFLDPYIYRLLCEKAKQPFKIEVMYEDVICAHLVKQMQEVYYTAHKKELDFLVSCNNQMIGIEVKCQNKIQNEDYLSLFPVTKGFLITKNEFSIKKTTKGKYYALPIHCFLSLPFMEIVDHLS